MNIKEFIELYKNASEEDRKKAIDLILKYLLQSSEHQN